MHPPSIIVESTHVFVIQGKDKKVSESMLSFLRAIGLQPVEKATFIRQMNAKSPDFIDTLRKAFDIVQVVIILLIGEDTETILKAGIALGINRDKTLLIKIGSLISGLYMDSTHFNGCFEMDNSPESRLQLAQKLKDFGCNTNTQGDSWISIGNFTGK